MRSTPSGPNPATNPPASRGAGGALIMLGLLLVAFNLRAAITSLGALLDEVRTGLHLSGAMAGVVTTLPAVAFAGFGALTPWLLRRFSPARVLVGAMVALAAGQLLRVSADAPAIFVGTSALALAGIAVANIMLPMLVKEYFPDRIGLVTGIYMMTLTVGATVAAAAAVPVAHAFGSWRVGLGLWAIFAAVAVLPWLPSALRRVRAHRSTVARAESPARVRPGRTRLGWAMASYFGAQALSGYAVMGWLAQLFRDAGHNPRDAGLLLAGVTALGVPIAFFMPTLTTRMRSLRPLVLTLSVGMFLGYLGLAVAPNGGALLWVVLLAVGQGGFPMILTVIGLRARTPEGTVALSAFAQSAGYVIAALGPLLVGLLYEASGSWSLPIGFLIIALGVQTLAGLAIARPRFIEDELTGPERMPLGDGRSGRNEVPGGRPAATALSAGARSVKGRPAGAGSAETRLGQGSTATCLESPSAGARAGVDHPRRWVRRLPVSSRPPRRRPRWRKSATPPRGR